MHQRRHPCGDLCDNVPAGSVEAETIAKSEARIDHSVGRAATRVGLVRDLRHPPGPANLSTADQNLDAQMATLEAAGCSMVRTETGDGATLAGRPELRTILDFIHLAETRGSHAYRPPGALDA